MTNDPIINAPISKIVEVIIKSMFGTELPETSRVQWHRDRITEALASLAGEESQWISTNDKLPEQEEDVIIKCTGHRVATTGYIHERGHWIISNGKGNTYKENQMHRVTHWQPLPEPPNENNIKPPHPSEREELEGFVEWIYKTMAPFHFSKEIIDRYLAEKQSKTEKK